MSIEDGQLKNILEAALMSVGKPMSMEQLMKLFDDEKRPSANRVKDALNLLAEECEGRGIELKTVASGYRFQARQDYSEWLSRLWEEKPAKYSRAYLETLALIAYRQPVTRAEIEEVRGVSVSSNIIRTMLEREWIRVVGHRDVPGRPALYATTKQFLDYFNMQSLEELPSLAEIRDLEDLSPELDLPEPGQLSDEPPAELTAAPEEGDSENQVDLEEAIAEKTSQEIDDADGLLTDEDDDVQLTDKQAQADPFENAVFEASEIESEIAGSEIAESEISSAETSENDEYDEESLGIETDRLNERLASDQKLESEFDKENG